MKQWFVILLSLLVNAKIYAQRAPEQLNEVEKKIFTMGALETLNIARITDTITRSFQEKIEKVNAIYYWIATNIAQDPKSLRSNDTKNAYPAVVLETRKASALGFATLFQEMCSQANIRCLLVSGHSKNNIEDINNISQENNHTWNVVQIGQSEDQWYYVDVTKASGYLIARQTYFVPHYSRSYFFANKSVFNLEHLPQNMSWLLGEGPRSYKEFYSLPLIEAGAYQWGVHRPFPVSGIIKTRTNKPVAFSFKTNAASRIIRIQIQMGEDKKIQKSGDIEFSSDNREVHFNYTFKKADSFPAKILINGEAVLTYSVESEEP